MAAVGQGLRPQGGISILNGRRDGAVAVPQPQPRGTKGEQQCTSENGAHHAYAKSVSN